MNKKPKPSTRKVGDKIIFDGISYEIRLNKSNRRYWKKIIRKTIVPILSPIKTIIPILSPIKTIIPILLPRKTIVPILLPRKTIVPILSPVLQVTSPTKKTCANTNTCTQQNVHKPCAFLSTPGWVYETNKIEDTIDMILTFYCQSNKNIKGMYTDTQTYMYDILNSMLSENNYKVYGSISMKFLEKRIVSSIDTIHFTREKKTLYGSYYVDLSQSPGEIQWKHATMLIVNNDKKTAEYFDPHGKSNFNLLNSTDITLNEWVSEYYPEYTYIPTSQTCPIKGPQAISRDSYCAAWTALYTYLRIKHKNLSSMQVVKYLLDLNHFDIVRIVESFICFQYKYLIDSGVKTIIDTFNYITDIYVLKLLENMRLEGDYIGMCKILFK